ncbi:GGDEF domain-containing protein [Thetidibacter halocola]|uniref:diguanylate cyclase n=1 Tax=Thetidibacter halocola TaxID=2827239 RepID=A0A8J7WGS7_9RHOB|nr:GGDEF domain-containing protein [Thetidibacter halocola]MBS0124734.1 diguanylate cyclase [Thetidibacter halocola]
MRLYRILDKLFPSSFGAKVCFVVICAGILPPGIIALHLFLTGGAEALASPFLVLGAMGSGGAVFLTIVAVQALLQALHELTHALHDMQGRRIYRPLPTRFGDEIGLAMRSANRMAEALGARVDPALVDSCIDPLTGVFTAEGFDTALREARGGTMLAIELDDFTGLNAADDGIAADRILVIIGRVLREAVRKGDVVGYCTPGAFSVFLSGAGREVARHVAERIRQQVARETAPFEPPVTVSVGLAVRNPEEEVSGLMRRAEEALDHARSGGRDRVALAGG